MRAVWARAKNELRAHWRATTALVLLAVQTSERTHEPSSAYDRRSIRARTRPWRTAVPVRSSLAAAIAGIVALLAALVVAASVQHLLISPPLYGLSWDAAFSDNSGGVSFAPGSKELKDLSSDPVAQFGIVVAGSLAVAALIAVWPARAAARTEPALVLRAE